MVARQWTKEATSALHSAAKSVVSNRLDHFPDLIIYRCLESASATLAESAKTAIEASMSGQSEVLGVPRRGYGPRPVEVLSPTSRASYETLVGILDHALAPASRQGDAWRQHRQFGRTGDHTHVVDLDFASCYELIDHDELCNELLLRSFDNQTVAELRAHLRGLGRHNRGLPQMLDASDRLADTYLSIIDRHIARQGYLAHRFADDIRVLAFSWETANSIVELAAEYGRSLGLILSAAKTNIRRTATFLRSEDAAGELLASFLPTRDDANDEDDPFGGWLAVADWYSLDEEEEDEEEEEENEEDDGPQSSQDDSRKIAYAALLLEWHQLFRSQDREDPSTSYPQGMSSLLGQALLSVASAADNLPRRLLLDLVFADASRLEGVCEYVLERHGRGERAYARAALSDLVGMARQSPWAKLWLLHTAERMGSGPRAILKNVRSWVVRQLEDPHEVVRAQAAWVAAIRGDLTTAAVRRLYMASTTLSRPALAAASAKQQNNGPALPEAQVNAIKADGPLNERAFRWAE